LPDHHHPDREVVVHRDGAQAVQQAQHRIAHQVGILKEQQHALTRCILRAAVNFKVALQREACADDWQPDGFGNQAHQLYIRTHASSLPKMTVILRNI